MRMTRLLLLAAVATACSEAATPAAKTSDAQTASDIAAVADALTDATGSDSTAEDAAPEDTGAVTDAIEDTAGPPPACSSPLLFDAKANGTKPFEKVGDFTVPTLDGDWTLSEQWNGCDAYIFLQGTNDPNYKVISQTWAAMKASWFKVMPKNVHVFFMAYTAKDSDAEQIVNAQREHLYSQLGGISEADQAHWTTHLHFVTVSAWNVPGWIGASLKKKGVFWFAIDPQQRRREIGMLQLPGASKLDFNLLAYEAQHMNFERDRDAALTAAQADYIELWKDEAAGSGWSSGGKYWDFTLPDASKLASYDTLELDMTQFCGTDHSDASCPDWDREAYLYVCSQPAAAELPSVASACDADAKLACACDSSDGVVRTGTRSCEGGKAFGACQCPCDTELYRMITSYKRQGRWVTDLSPLRPLLAGGKTRLRWYTVDDWRLSGGLRLRNSGKATKPFQTVALYGTEAFNEGYNAKFKPRKIQVPADAKAVKLVGIITGHGSATDTLNCAEFCPFDTIFTIGGTAYTRAHKEAGTQKGCMDKVAEGVLPNQAGTWPYGRAGWCPGWDVKPWVVDVTASAKPGTEVEVSYKALLGGQEFKPVPTGKGDYGPVIKMSSYLVFEK
jgi:hypothetical protein